MNRESESINRLDGAPAWFREISDHCSWYLLALLLIQSLICARVKALDKPVKHQTMFLLSIF